MLITKEILEQNRAAILEKRAAHEAEMKAAEGALYFVDHLLGLLEKEEPAAPEVTAASSGPQLVKETA